MTYESLPERTLDKRELQALVADLAARPEAWREHVAFSDRERQAMANTKSSVKKELGIRGRRRRRRKAGAVAEAPGKGPRGPRANAGGTLEQLEVAIDRCLSAARGYEDRDEEMQKVVKHLRVARNELVWILGKKPQRTSVG